MHDRDNNFKKNNTFIIKNVEENNIEYNFIKEYNYKKLKNAQSFQDIQEILKQQRKKATLNAFAKNPTNSSITSAVNNQQLTGTPNLTNQTGQNVSSRTNTATNTVVQTDAKTVLQGKPITLQQRLWGSPTNDSGLIYEFNRGAIGIGIDGKVATFSLDDNILHHSDATYFVSSELSGSFVSPNNSPFNAGLESAQNGIVLIQLEGAAALIYLPNNGITQEQQNALEAIMKPRHNFEISFTHLGQIYADDNVTLDSLLRYTSSYIQSSVKVR